MTIPDTCTNHFTSPAAAWLLVVPSAEIIKSHYDTILTTMRTSVSYIGNESETFYF